MWMLMSISALCVVGWLVIDPLTNARQRPGGQRIIPTHLISPVDDEGFDDLVVETPARSWNATRNQLCHVFEFKTKKPHKITSW